MNEKTKNILKKILLILFGIILLLPFMYLCLAGLLTLPYRYGLLLLLLICFFGFFIVFFPSILVLYLIFKKVKSINFRILLIAFVIPFTNLLYLIIEHLCFNSNLYSYVIGFCSLFISLPLYYIIALCTPKSILPVKWIVIKTIILTAIFGVVLILLSDIIVPVLEGGL